MPELKPAPYEHRRPRRPRYLSRRTEPPPQRAAPPDMRLMLYLGIGLAAIVAALATPYVIGYLLEALFG
jgi:hypothetical protein